MANYSPIDELLFKGPEIHELLCNVVLTNTTTSVVAYKVCHVHVDINLSVGGGL